MNGELGQLLILGIEGLTLSSEEKKFIQQENIGGVILFAKNYQNVEQLCLLVNELQNLRNEDPLFISVDYEGGRVQRFKNQFTLIPPMRSIALKGSPKICFEVHKVMAMELRACGINLNFSPVCDVISNLDNKVIGDRAFGTDSETVTKYITAAIRGLQSNGIMACAKHFPGHGMTWEDSHEQLPVVNKSLDELIQSDFIPFIKASKSRVEFMMMAHILLTQIDSDFPSSLSEKCYQLMREHIKFSKIIITDDLEMDAITKNFPVEEASFRALKAGSDMVLCRSFNTGVKILKTIKEKYKTRELPKTAVEEKLGRILKCKKSYLANYSPLYIPDVLKQFQHSKQNDFINKLHP